MPLCAFVVGVFLATPERFTIAYAQTELGPHASAEELLETLADLYDANADWGAADFVSDVGRPRCLRPSEQEEGR